MGAGPKGDKEQGPGILLAHGGALALFLPGSDLSTAVCMEQGSAVRFPFYKEVWSDVTSPCEADPGHVTGPRTLGGPWMC